MAEAAMAESATNLATKARDILATPSHEGLAMIVDQLFMHQESDEYKTARALYDFCVSDFPNCLTLMLLKIYRFSSDDVVRLRSIYHLSQTLTAFRNRKFELSLVALHEIKPLLISCLTMERARKCDIEILRVIVSFVADNVMILDNGGWEELSDCILSLANTDPIRAFNIFIDLPSLYGEFIDLFLQKFLEEVYKVLLHPEKDRVEDWILALKAAVKLGIQLIDSEMRFVLTRDILDIVLKSADEVVAMGMEEEFLQRGLQSLEKFLAKDAKVCKWSTKQCGFVAEFAFGVSGTGTHTMEPAKKIYQMVTRMQNYVHNPDIKLSPSRIENQDLDVESDRELYNNLKAVSSVDIMNMVALTKMDDRSREIAVRRLHDLLCDHTYEKAVINVSEIRQLQPLLISCLAEVEMPDNTFKILGQVVFHVANELFGYEEEKWSDLWVYIATQCKREFEKAVYIFQCLTMMLHDKASVICVSKILLPEISRRLDPPRELLVDNSCWVLAFTGAYCVAIRLVDDISHAVKEIVKEFAHKMIDSVRELVERGMEVGLVRRAFRDLETIVKKQFDWYETNEYSFVKSLLWKLYAIKGMSMESKIVLWRINLMLEKLHVVLKVLPESELDWLNQPETA